MKTKKSFYAKLKKKVVLDLMILPQQYIKIKHYKVYFACMYLHCLTQFELC